VSTGELSGPATESDLFSCLSYSPQDYLIEETAGEPSFYIPKDAELTIDQGNMGSRISIRKKGSFQFTITLETKSIGNGLPRDHPQRTYVDNNRAIRQYTSRITFEAEFEYPDVEEPYFDEYKDYAENILTEIKKNWSMSEMIEEMPSQKLFEIESKIDDIRDDINRD
jgi:hypothetical protein